MVDIESNHSTFLQLFLVVSQVVGVALKARAFVLIATTVRSVCKAGRGTSAMAVASAVAQRNARGATVADVHPGEVRLNGVALLDFFLHFQHLDPPLEINCVEGTRELHRLYGLSAGITN